MISLALLVLALTPPSVSPSGSLAAMPTAITRADGDDVSTLSDAYQEAVTAWGEKMAQARKEKKVDEVRKQHPAFEYYPKFEKLAAGGNNEALLWMASHLQDKLLDKDKEKAACSAKKLEMFTKLVKESAGEDWTDYLVRGISTQSKWLTDEQSDKLLLDLAANPKASKETAAGAIAAIATRLESIPKPSDADKARIAELHARLLKDFDGTKVVAGLKSAEFRDKNLQEGMAVPDFTTKDVEGVEFKLSDYKGKVVLLDFWGFW